MKENIQNKNSHSRVMYMSASACALRRNSKDKRPLIGLARTKKYLERIIKDSERVHALGWVSRLRGNPERKNYICSGS